MPAAVVAPGASHPVLEQAVVRIRERATGPLDVLAAMPVREQARRYDWIVVLDVDPAADLAHDGYRMVATGNHPITIQLTGTTERAVLFAAYRFAEELVAGGSLAELNVTCQPTVPHRYALVSASTRFGEHYRPDLFDRTVSELPALGLNGTLIIPSTGHGTPAGRGRIPIDLDANGNVRADEHELAAWHAVFDRIKEYGLDIMVAQPADIPPQFSVEQVQQHYAGAIVLPDYEQAVEASIHAQMGATLSSLPQIDAILFHSLECEWLWGPAVSVFPCKDAAAGERAFEAYLTALKRVCDDHGVDLLFWSHVSRMTGRSIRELRDILARHPQIVNVEDGYWPNVGWPFLKPLGYLSPDLRRTVHQRTRFGLFADTTDGEYYGAGLLPTGYPEPQVAAAREASARQAEYALLRLDEHDRTVDGTLFGVNAIMPRAAAAQWWQPTRHIDDIWHEWAADRYSPTAAPDVVAALGESGAIIRRGFVASGMNLLDHSGIAIYNWTAPAGRCFRLFGKPGTLLVDQPWDDVAGVDFVAAQTGAVAIDVTDYHQANAEAQAAADRAIGRIDAAREHLSQRDHQQLRKCFTDAKLVLQALRRLTQVVSLIHKGANAAAELNELTCFAETLDPELGRLPQFACITYQDTTYRAYGLTIALAYLDNQYRQLS